MKKIIFVLLLTFTGTVFAQYQGDYADLGLPSGTQWKIINEGSLMTYDDAVKTYGKQLPTYNQFEELFAYCEYVWTSKGLKLTGPNGKFIILPADGKYDCAGKYENEHTVDYWSRTAYSDGTSYGIFYWYEDNSSSVMGLRGNADRCNRFAIRLVR